MATENDTSPDAENPAAAAEEAAAQAREDQHRELPDAPEEVEAEIPEPPKSRRQRAQEAADAQFKRLTELAEAQAKRQQEFEERMARTFEQRQQPQYQAPAPQYQQPTPQQGPRNYDRELFDLERERRQLFGTNDIEKFMEVSNKVAAIQAEKIINERLSSIRIPQPAREAPAWVRAVEAQYPDVLAHPMGDRSVRHYVSLMDAAGENVHSVDALRKAFEKAAGELGLRQARQQARRQDDDSVSIPEPGQGREARQAMLGNSRGQNLSGRGGSGGSGAGKGGPRVSGLQKGWEGMAKMAYPNLSASDAQAKYLRAYAKMNPDKVTK